MNVNQGGNGEEDPADEQLLVDEWVGGGGGGRALRRFQGGPASNKWEVGQQGGIHIVLKKRTQMISCQRHASYCQSEVKLTIF